MLKPAILVKYTLGQDRPSPKPIFVQIENNRLEQELKKLYKEHINDAEIPYVCLPGSNHGFQQLGVCDCFAESNEAYLFVIILDLDLR